MRELSNTPESYFNCLKIPSLRSLDPGHLPDVIQPKGLDAKRQWYLYEQIRIFCPTNLQADMTCPKPLVPRHSSEEEAKATKPSPSRGATTDVIPSSKRKCVPGSTLLNTSPMGPSTSKKKPRKCTLCGQIEHNRRSCPSS